MKTLFATLFCLISLGGCSSAATELFGTIHHHETYPAAGLSHISISGADEVTSVEGRGIDYIEVIGERRQLNDTDDCIDTDPDNGFFFVDKAFGRLAENCWTTVKVIVPQHFSASIHVKKGTTLISYLDGKVQYQHYSFGTQNFDGPIEELLVPFMQ